MERLVGVRGATVPSSVEHDHSKVTAEGLRDRLSRKAPRRFAAEETPMEQEHWWVTSTGIVHPGRVPQNIYVVTHRNPPELEDRS
jgi:hypothetical protein